jgi:serine/threonine protein kinase
MPSVNPEFWKEASPYLDRALELSPEERTAWLESFRASRPDLARFIEDLLKEHSEAAEEHFLERSLGPLGEALPKGREGQNVGPYTLLSPVGQGGMGSVWLGERSDGRFQRRVAIKFLRFAFGTRGAAERFAREGKILGQLAHAHVAELIDAGVTPTGEPYLVLEYVDGQPIDEYCDQRALTVDARLRLFLDVLDAVAAAHAQLIVHRDIKPSNVLVRNDGQVKLLDFGIAKLLADTHSPVEATLVTLELGAALTPRFASPEQLTGTQITTATDVYALGILLYVLLTGHHPAGADTKSTADLVKAIVETEPPRPSDAVDMRDEDASRQRGTSPEKLRRALRGDLDLIVGKALKKNPLERYASVPAFGDDLRRYLRHEPISARPDIFTYRASKFIRRNKTGVAVTALAVLGISAGAMAVQREAQRAEYRFQQVRKFAHTVLFDIDPEIENLAGATKARELLVNTSLEYLDSLARGGGNDPTLQLELATAYEKIGDAQGNSRYSNLGHPEAALESYRKAAEISRKLGASPQALEILAAAYTKMGIVQGAQLGYRHAGRQSLRLAASIADSIPPRTGKQEYLLRVEAYGYLGDMDEAYDPLRAAGPVRHALDLAREWSRADPDPQAKYHVAVLARDWADILWETGDLNAARNALLESDGVFADILKQQPDNAEWGRQRIAGWERLGLLSGSPDFFNLGDRKAATDWLRKLLDKCEQYLSTDPSNVRARLDASEAVAELAAVYRDFDPLRAEKMYERSLVLSGSALTADPNDFEILYNQSLARLEFAPLLDRLGKHAEAAGQLRRAIDAFQKLAIRGWPAARRCVGAALNRRASHRMEMGDAAGAKADFRQSEEILVALFQQNPNNLLILRDLADCYRAQGDFAAHRSRWQDARLKYQKSLDLWESWTKIGKSSVYDQRQRQLAASLLRKALEHLQMTSSRGASS